MAVVTTSIEANLDNLPFEGYREPVASRTPWPRGQIFAYNRNEAIAAVGAGDNQKVLWTINLPAGFGYALIDYHVNIVKINSNNFPADAWVNIYDLESDARYQIPMAASSVEVTHSVGGNTFVSQPYRLLNPYQGIIYNQENSRPKVEFSTYNTTAQDNAYQLDATARFLTFDIEQVLALPVNQTVPIR